MTAEIIEPGTTAVRPHALVVRMSLDPLRPDDTIRHLQRDVAVWATGQPGFLSGQWLCSPDSTHALGIVTFQTSTDADAAAQGPRANQRDDARAWNIDAVDIYDQVARA
jgi:hypothetical protein